MQVVKQSHLVFKSFYTFAGQWEQFSAEHREHGDMLSKIREDQQVRGQQMDRIEATLLGEKHGQPEITGRARCKNRAVLTGILKVPCNSTFLALSHSETGFMKPSPMKLVALCDSALIEQSE